MRNEAVFLPSSSSLTSSASAFLIRSWIITCLATEAKVRFGGADAAMEAGAGAKEEEVDILEVWGVETLGEIARDVWFEEGEDGLEETTLDGISVDTDLGFDFKVLAPEMVGFLSMLESDRDGAALSSLDMGKGLFRSDSDSWDDKFFSIAPRIKNVWLFKWKAIGQFYLYPLSLLMYVAKAVKMVASK